MQTYNLFQITSTKQYFIAHQSIPFAKMPKNNITLETQIQAQSPCDALQQFSSYNPITIYVHNKK